MVNDAEAIVPDSTSLALTTQHVIPFRLPQELVTATQAACADQGFPITVSVLDRDGGDILLARGDGTTGASVGVARDKAYAAVGFQNPTSALEDRVKTTGFGILTVEGFTVLPGGLPIKA
ncbi:MAG: heme-binding protein [Candidatus Nitrosocosmicus sp.]|nr:heme-binding protein [Candidatus Nitrosocosmicus sp.]MDN5868312.1 heme-binding protein [Candidatus Nitrosocosmicus sp.]